MDSYGFLCLEIIGFMDSLNFGKKMYSDSSFFMYSDSEVQKLKGFGFGEISTSANHRGGSLISPHLCTVVGRSAIVDNS